MTSNALKQLTEQAGWTGIYSQWISPTEREHLTVPVTVQQIEAFVKAVEKRKCEELARKIEAMPFGDTAQSFAHWIRSQE